MEVVNVSPSLLRDVVSCSTKAWVRHCKGYTSKSEAIKAVAGQAWHAAMAEYFTPHDDEDCFHSSGDVMARFHAIYDSAYERLTADKLEPALTPANLHRLLARWIEMHPASALPWRKVLLVEEAFCSRTFEIGATSVNLIVRPDLVVECSDGTVRWVDTKTTGWRIGDPSWRRALRLSLQTQLYTDAVMRLYGDRAALGGWINAVELKQLPSDPTRKCRDHGVVYAECGNEHAKAEFIECMTSAERVDVAVEDARMASAAFVTLLAQESSTALSMEGIANDSCRFCSFADYCEASRPDAALDSLLHHEPWIIEEGVRA